MKNYTSRASRATASRRSSAKNRLDGESISDAKRARRPKNLLIVTCPKDVWKDMHKTIFVDENLRSIKKYERNDRWVSEHKKEPREDYKDKFIAVKDQGVISADPRLKNLLKSLRENDVDTTSVVVEFIPGKDMVTIYYKSGVRIFRVR